VNGGFWKRHKAIFLDSRFKTVAHISRSQQEEIIKDNISDELVDTVVYISEECEDVEVSEVETDVTEESTPARNQDRLYFKNCLTSDLKINLLPVKQLLYQEVRLCKLR